MGYYTNYLVETTSTRYLTDRDLDAINDRIEAITGYSGIEVGVGTDGIKWYDHDEDMLILSKEFPDVLFEVTGDGEETGDMWQSLYLNGESIHAKVDRTYIYPKDFSRSEFYAKYKGEYVPPAPVYKISDDDYTAALGVLGSIVDNPTAKEVQALKLNAEAVVSAYKAERGL